MFSVIWLLVSAYLYGYAVTGERGWKAPLFGFPALVVAMTFFSVISIPLHWLVFLALGAIGAAARLKLVDEKQERMGGEKKHAKTSGGIREMVLENVDARDAVGVLAAVLMFGILLSGAFSYPYLEDDDPWVHALGVSQVAHTFSGHRPVAPSIAEFDRWYLEPYPPAFDILLGVLRELNDSTQTTMKFFNALLAGLAVLALYVWLREALPESGWLAAIAALFVASIPGFMSHFIWSQTLAIMLMLVSFIMLSRLEKDAKMLPAAVLSVAAVLVTQPSVAVTFGVITASFLVVKAALGNREVAKNIFIALAAGLILSFIVFWGPAYLKFGKEQFFAGIGFSGSFLQGGSTDDTSGGVVYGLDDYIFPPAASKIDQATGIGLAIILLDALALAYIANDARKGKWDSTLVFLAVFFIIGILGTEGNALPLKLFPHRFWVFLSVPAAALAAYAFTRLPKRFYSHLFDGQGSLSAISGGVKSADNKQALSSISILEKGENEIIFKAKNSEGAEGEYRAKEEGGKLEVYSSSGALRIVAALAVFVVLYITSIEPRMAVQTAMWPPGAMWSAQEELAGYVSLMSLPADTKVMPLCAPDSRIAGFDKLSEPWNADYLNFKKTAFNRTASEVADFMKAHGYQYMIFDVSCAKGAGTQGVQAKLDQYATSAQFQNTGGNGAFFLFKLK